MDIGIFLKTARENAGLKQTDVKKHTNINNKTLSNWENNVSKPSPEDLRILATLYNTTVDYLIGKKEEPNKLDLKGALFCKSPEITLSPTEKFIIETYRQLDERGQNTVLDTIEREFAYAAIARKHKAYTKSDEQLTVEEKRKIVNQELNDEIKVVKSKASTGTNGSENKLSVLDYIKGFRKK